MKIVTILSIFILLFSCSPSKKSTPKTDNEQLTTIHENITNFKTITFPSKDGLLVTADLYQVKESKDFILLCHQAGFSRGEYIEIAKKLNKLGYSCLATDQRSGKEVKNVVNETFKRATAKGLATTYLDAKPDIESAIDYAYKLNNNKSIILVGSSYSASLSLLIATTNDKIKKVAAFSPGEYLEGINLTESITNLNKPVFITSSKKEIEQVTSVTKNIKSDSLIHFKPEVNSIHGSRALWESTAGNGACWKAFSSFLDD